MPIRIKCPAGHTLVISDARRGQTLRCPKCQGEVLVPLAEEAERVPPQPQPAAPIKLPQSVEVITRPSEPTVAEQAKKVPSPKLAAAPEKTRPVQPSSKAKPAAASLIAKSAPATPNSVVEKPRPEQIRDLEQVDSEATKKTLEACPPPPVTEVPPIIWVQEVAPSPEPAPAVIVSPSIPDIAWVEPSIAEPPVIAPPIPGNGVEFAQPINTPLPVPPAPRVEAPLPPVVSPAAPPLPEMPIAPPAAQIEVELPPPIVHAEANLWNAYTLAAAMIATAVLSVIPSVWDTALYIQDPLAAPLARWALVLAVLGIVQIAYAIYLIQLPDWTTVWMVTLYSLALAAFYAMALGLTIVSGENGWVVQFLHLSDKVTGGKAALWCLCMISITTLLAFFAGRMSVRWHRAEEMLRQV